LRLIALPGSIEHIHTVNQSQRIQANRKSPHIPTHQEKKIIMKISCKFSHAALTVGSCALATGIVAGSAQAAIYTLAGFTRTAGGAATTVTNDFVPDEGWTGSPVNSTGTADTTPIYLTTTVSWTATASNIGTFNVRFNLNDDGGAARWGMGKSTNTAGSGFDYITLNGLTDPDGAGPATARPTIQPVDTSVVTTVTLVMKVDHSLAGTSPGGDYWFADEGLQSGAMGFMWINPNLGSTEASQFTPWAAWRSGNTGYQGVSFISDTDAVDLVFSNIAVYTEGDSPFVPESSTALLGSLGMLALLRRRRNS
jgi:hypothetical protein